MSRKKVHVFVGAGPANLHRALRMLKEDPDAEFVFIDNRLQPDAPEGEYLDRELSRANIFRFEKDEVTQKFIDDGVLQEDLSKYVYEREFDVKTGFQKGDEKVFSNKKFTQIQIRDLQKILLKTIMNKKPGTHLVRAKIETEKDGESNQEVFIESVWNQLIMNNIKCGPEDLSIHNATGALDPKINPDAIYYPEKGKKAFKSLVSDDLNAMTSLPYHGTVTYRIDQQRTKITCEELEEAQISLDRAQWQDKLRTFGWTLVRPPRVRIFYCKDILYVGAEIPHKIYSEKDGKVYNKSIEGYTRKIAKMAFPTMKERIESLPARKHLRTRFPTHRGESGKVIYHSDTKKYKGVTLYSHGDQRYLPHYQTGSGFVTAFNQNELYVDIYKQKSFGELYKWAVRKKHIDLSNNPIKNIAKDFLKRMDLGLSDDCIDQIAEYYTHLDKNDEFSEKVMLKIKRDLNKWYVNKYRGEQDSTLNVKNAVDKAIQKITGEQSDMTVAFKDDLYTVLSRDIIEGNKKKVGKYFGALHYQEIELFGQGIENNEKGNLLELYNSTHRTQYKYDDFQGQDPRHVAIKLLESPNTKFQRKVAPLFVNKNMELLKDNEIRHIVNMHLLNYKEDPEVAYKLPPHLSVESLKNISKEDSNIEVAEITRDDLSKFFRVNKGPGGETQIIMGGERWRKNDETTSKKYDLVVKMREMLGDNDPGKHKFISYKRTTKKGFFQFNKSGFVIDLEQLNKPENSDKRLIFREILCILHEYSQSYPNRLEFLSKAAENLDLKNQQIKKP